MMQCTPRTMGLRNMLTNMIVNGITQTRCSGTDKTTTTDKVSNHLKVVRTDHHSRGGQGSMVLVRQRTPRMVHLMQGVGIPGGINVTNNKGTQETVGHFHRIITQIGITTTIIIIIIITVVVGTTMRHQRRRTPGVPDSTTTTITTTKDQRPLHQRQHTQCNPVVRISQTQTVITITTTMPNTNIINPTQMPLNRTITMTTTS
eukprot:PhF_6_TR6954/c3_g1_i1/m.10229